MKSKAWSALCVLLCMILLLHGCHRAEWKTVLENDTYRIYEIDGTHYAQCRKSYRNPPNEGIAVSDENFPRFSTVAEMKQKIVSGDFSAAELTMLQNYGWQYNENLNLYKTHDPNEIYDVVLPAYTKLEFIQWRGATYRFYYSGPDGEGYVTVRYPAVTGEVSASSSGAFPYLSEEKTVLISKTKGEDGLGDVYIYQTRLADHLSDRQERAQKYRAVHYEIEKNGIQYTIGMMYDSAEAEVPSSIVLRGAKDDIVFSTHLSDLRGDVSLDWLTTFALTLYGV